MTAEANHGPPLPSIGVTGTNGKTSTVWLLAHALRHRDPALTWTCTLGSFIGKDLVATEFTYQGFRQVVQDALRRGGRTAVLELTSQALAGGFAAHWPCRIGVFTNLSHDHLDRHGSFEHYLASKAQLFVHLPRGGTAVLNADEDASAHLERILPGPVRVLRYGRAAVAPGGLRLDRVVERRDGTRLHVTLPDGTAAHFDTRFCGAPFADNTVAALAALWAWGMDANEAMHHLAAVDPPPGRFQWVADHPGVVVDYAHSPAALAQVVAVARRLCRGSLTVVFGAGGGRDRAKRPAMGAAARAADRVILTSDNPRHEDPRAIVQDLRGGLEGACVHIEIDRRQAITAAIMDAGDDDVVLVAGKGHEPFQIVGEERQPFSDVCVAQAVLAQRRRG